MPARWKFLAALMTFTVILRLLPYVLPSVLPYLMANYDATLDASVIFYPWNFSPMMAISLYAGATLADRRLRFSLPLLTLLLSDLGIWAVTGQFGWAFPDGYWSSYLCNAIAVVLGAGLGHQTGSVRTLFAVGTGIVAETLFFVVTNFVYFLIQTDLPHTAAGLLACYVAAIPFAGRSFASTAFYSSLLFSPLAMKANAGSQATSPVLQTAQIG